MCAFFQPAKIDPINLMRDIVRLIRDVVAIANDFLHLQWLDNFIDMVNVALGDNRIASPNP